MKSTLDSLARVSRHQSDQLTVVSVAELLADMEELHRPEFLQRSIDFRLSIAPALPMVLCQAQHLRHAVLHCLQFAIEAVDGRSYAQGLIPALPPAAIDAEPKTIRLEATSEGNVVQIMVAHSGPGFLQPDRAFDPLRVRPAERGDSRSGPELMRHDSARPQRARLRRKPGTARGGHHFGIAGGVRFSRALPGAELTQGRSSNSQLDCSRNTRWTRRTRIHFA